MRIFAGETRRVITLPSLGIVVKLPRVYLFQWIRHLVRSTRIISLGYASSTLQGDTEQRSTMRHYLFRGICHNWQEFLFWRRTKNPFLQPTYFSLLGIANIQKFGKEHGLNHLDLWSQLLDLTGWECFADSHAFNQVENYIVEHGQLKMVDYGSPKSREIIAKHGYRISCLFDMAYSREEKQEL